MGALHEGHHSLIRLARERAGETGQVVVSVFVNPIQFDRLEDLANYPITLDADLECCRRLGVDLVFSPDADGMYDTDRSVTVTESSLSTGLCGATRPGHFDGVCTVVLKLFLLCQCDAAVFGEKDFQQLAVIRRMVRDLDIPVEVISGPTVREPDGLAMSSRNLRLTPEQRADAPRIRQLLMAAAASTEPWELRLHALRETLESTGLARIDSLELVDASTLKPVGPRACRAVLAVAAYYGKVRLIDHIGIDFQP